MDMDRKIFKKEVNEPGKLTPVRINTYSSTKIRVYFIVIKKMIFKIYFYDSNT